MCVLSAACCVHFNTALALSLAFAEQLTHVCLSARVSCVLYHLVSMSVSASNCLARAALLSVVLATT